jgi:hypothetical protein
VTGVSKPAGHRGGGEVVRDAPFRALGLPARADLSDEDVRAAWRRVAAATHPDRDDGGDAGRFGAAAAAYDTLRTSFGRGEALADLGPTSSAARAARHGAHRFAHPLVPRFAYRAMHSAMPRFAYRAMHPAMPRFVNRAMQPAARHARRAGAPDARAGDRAWRRLALRVAAAGCVTTAAVLAVGWTPATVGVLTGALTWVTVTARPWRPGGAGRGEGLPATATGARPRQPRD